MSQPGARSADKTPQLVLAAGALYFAAILFRDWILAVFGIPVQVTPGYLPQFGWVHVLAGVALRMPALAMICIVWAQRPHSRFRASLHAEPLRALTWTVLITLAVSFVLNLFGVWPFTWRWASGSTSSYVGALVASGQWFATALWIFLGVAIGPMIEESVFRFGVLQSLLDWTGSKPVAVAGSSAVFALGHLGYLPADLAHTVNASWLFAASILLGILTLARDGRVTLSLAAHVARNGLEVSLLFLLVRPGAS